MFDIILVTWLTELPRGRLYSCFINILLTFQGSKAVANMLTTLFFPIVPFLFQCVVVAMFTVVALYLSSAGIPEYRVAYPVKIEGFANLRVSSSPLPYI